VLLIIQGGAFVRVKERERESLEERKMFLQVFVKGKKKNGGVLICNCGQPINPLSC
jgi:hypothetical protein